MPELNNEHLDLLERGGDLFLPNLSVDIAIFGYEDNQLKVPIIGNCG